MKLYKAIAQTLAALGTCYQYQKDGRGDYSKAIDLHEEKLKTFNGFFPSGSGFDSGTDLELEACKEDKLVFSTSFHHMDEGGGYCGWSEHKVIVTPSLVFGFNLRVTGRDKNGIKEYIHEVFGELLQRNYKEGKLS